MCVCVLCTLNGIRMRTCVFRGIFHTKEDHLAAKKKKQEQLKGAGQRDDRESSLPADGGEEEDADAKRYYLTQEMFDNLMVCVLRFSPLFSVMLTSVDFLSFFLSLSLSLSFSLSLSDLTPTQRESVSCASELNAQCGGRTLRAAGDDGFALCAARPAGGPRRAHSRGILHRRFH